MRARKSFYTSALCAISVLFLSLIPIPASSAAAGNYEITIDTTNVGNTGEDAKPIPSGTSWTGTINLFNTQAGFEATDQVSIVATVTSGPDATDMTSKCAFTPQNVAGFSLSVISASTGELGIDPTAVVARLVNTKLPLFDFSCPTDIGGPYTMTITEGSGFSKAGFATGNFPTPTANNPDTGRIMVSGIAVTQAIKRGLRGESYPNNRVEISSTLPSQTKSMRYSITSSGVGGIKLVTANNAAVIKSSDHSYSIVTFENSLASSIYVELFSDSLGAQFLRQNQLDESTGRPVAASITQIVWRSPPNLDFSKSLARMAPITTIPNSQLTVSSANYTKILDIGTYSTPVIADGEFPRISTIQVTLVNDDLTPALDGHIVTAIVKGSALVLVDNSGFATDGTGKASSYTLVEGSENIAWVHVSSDYKPGPAEISIFVTDIVTGKQSLLATKTVYSWGELAKLEISQSNYRIGLAGYTTGAATSSRYATAEVGSPNAVSSVGIQGNGGQTTTPAFIVKATDALGQLMNLESPPEVISSDTNVATSGACSQDDGSTTYSSGKGYGYYNCFFSIASTAKSGDKASLTIRSLDPARAAGSTSYISTTYEVSVGGYETDGEVVMTFDKEIYQPGDEMTVTIIAKDEKGNPVFDGHPAPEISLNLGFLGTVKAGYFVGGRFSSDDATGKKTLTAPSDFGIVAAAATTASGKNIKFRVEVKDLELIATSNSLLFAKEAAIKSISTSGVAADVLKRAQIAASKAANSARSAKSSVDKVKIVVSQLSSTVNSSYSGAKVAISQIVKKVTAIIQKL